MTYTLEDLHLIDVGSPKFEVPKFTDKTTNLVDMGMAESRVRGALENKSTLESNLLEFFENHVEYKVAYMDHSLGQSSHHEMKRFVGGTLASYEGTELLARIGVLDIEQFVDTADHSTIFELLYVNPKGTKDSSRATGKLEIEITPDFGKVRAGDFRSSMEQLIRMQRNPFVDYDGKRIKIETRQNKFYLAISRNPNLFRFEFDIGEGYSTKLCSIAPKLAEALLSGNFHEFE